MSKAVLKVGGTRSIIFHVIDHFQEATYHVCFQKKWLYGSNFFFSFVSELAKSPMKNIIVQVVLFSSFQTAVALLVLIALAHAVAIESSSFLDAEFDEEYTPMTVTKKPSSGESFQPWVSVKNLKSRRIRTFMAVRFDGGKKKLAAVHSFEFGTGKFTAVPLSSINTMSFNKMFKVFTRYSQSTKSVKSEGFLWDCKISHASSPDVTMTCKVGTGKI
jgi:hypothetical protein